MRRGSGEVKKIKKTEMPDLDLSIGYSALEVYRYLER